ncbi:MFS transporter [Streptomyces sp. E5N91]|uniref:MFS transporter n=1 Tax=Streptomyces sp. E5N91 TaxID=1851996 RepID=UPI000EF56209|nr:MFS transporter [Streptomyces sp. E5N91]
MPTHKVTPESQRWKALGFISLAQLMVALDSTIVNIALPNAQHALGISDANRQWAITAYALAFGGLLLLGGRIADKWGRKRAFTVGLLGFAMASAIGGLATNEVLLFGSRALQGVFGALLAPAALSLITVTFTDVKERAKAFGVFGAIAGAGGAVGLLLGGILTEYLNWRWTFFVNIPFAIVAAVGVALVVHEPAEGRHRAPLDIPGAILSTLGLVALVYGFTRAETSGWASTSTIGLLAASVVLLAAFVVVETKMNTPLLPLRVLTERVRGGAYASMALAVVGQFGVFLFLTYYLQVVQGYSAVRTGLAFLPLALSFVVGATQIGARLTTRLSARTLMTGGFLVGTVGMLLMTQLSTGSPYFALILPALVLQGVGMGAAIMVAMSLSTHGVRPQDAGVASAMANVSQQVGGAVGTALLNTIAASATGGYLVSHAVGGELAQAQALVHGYTAAIWWAAGAMAAAALIAAVLVRPGRSDSLRVGSGNTGVHEERVPTIAH